MTGTSVNLLVSAATRISCLLLLASARGAEEPASSSWPGNELFASGLIREIKIDLPASAAASLRDKPRDYVAATVVEGGKTYTNVGIHLKGSVGSFRPLDNRPSLTLDFTKLAEGQKFHGLRKIHLNNSVEDPSYVNEIIGGEMFRAAGVPTPRATHALVVLNGRACGLYVLKEGFTEDFLSCHFKRLSNQLHEPGIGRDVDGQLRRNSVLNAVGNGAALQALANAALEPDSAQRWQRLNASLDMDRFLTFMSLEIMLAHRDGYCLARNNFRIYHDLDSDKLVFFPHGMDQLFGPAELPWQPRLAGLVANAVMTTPQGKQQYFERFGSLLTNAFNVTKMTNRVDQLVEEIRPVLRHDEWVDLRNEAARVKERIVQRRRYLDSHFSKPGRQPLEFPSGVEPLCGWEAMGSSAQAKMKVTSSSDNLPALYIAASGETAAAWTTTALVPRGRYRFEGRVKIASVQPLPYGIHHGAGLRIRGARRQTGSLTGDSSWRLLVMDFRVEQPLEEVEFICELRAQRGEAWFDVSSLRILRLQDL